MHSVLVPKTEVVKCLMSENPTNCKERIDLYSNSANQVNVDTFISIIEIDVRLPTCNMCLIKIQPLFL